jgi:hypothetical protein
MSSEALGKRVLSQVELHIIIDPCEAATLTSFGGWAESAMMGDEKTPPERSTANPPKL